MKANNKILLLLLSCGVLFYSCNKDEKLNSTSVFVDSTIPKNALDTYLYTNFLKPYNLEILYKYVDKETDLSYRLVPAPYEASIRLSKLMLHAVLRPYDELTGSTQFLKDNFPKIITYIGSVPVKSNGVVVLGTAEAGVKVNLFNLVELNDATGRDTDFLNTYFFKTIHHEFQHILNQNKPFPSNFQELTGLKYVEDEWDNKYKTTKVAVKDGFISPYSSKAHTEDFAEIYSIYITRSEADFNAIINLAGENSPGKAIILAKLAIVKSYMISTWGVDMDLLRSNVLGKYASLNTFDQVTLN